MISTRIRGCCIALVVAFTALGSGTGWTQETSSYSQWLRFQTAEEQIPGVAMAIVSSQGVLDLQTWGTRHQGRQEPVDGQTIFRIASVSKTFAGTVVSKLVSQELQSWGAPISTILPDYSIGTGASTRQMTLKHIVSHTTGLMPHAYSNILDAGIGYEQIKAKFHEIPTVCSPGRCYGYQNVIFSLISDVVETSTGKSYEEYLLEQIFQPLGMKNASVGLEAFSSSSNSSSPHRYARGAWHSTSTNPAYYTVAPASGINASIKDMILWAQANLGAFPDVLPLSLLELQHQPVVETPRGNYFNRWPAMDRAYYALGWRVFDYRGARVVHHGGGVRGFRSEMVLVPERDIALVVLFNAESSFANDVVPHFLDQVLSNPLSAQNQTGN